MQYLWTYTRRMTPWTGKYSCRSWRSTLWDLGTAASFTHTGTGFRWWLERGEGEVLLGGIPRFQGGDPGGTTVPHHFKCSGGRSGVALDLVGGWRRGWEGRVGKGGDTPRRIFLCG